MSSIAQPAAYLTEMTEPMDKDKTTHPASKRTSRMPTLTGGRHLGIKVRLADAELNELRRRANIAGLSVQRFLIEAAMTGSAAQAAEQRRALADSQRARLVLTSVSNNVNQLAKWANTNHVLPDNLDAVLDDVRRATADEHETSARLLASFEPPQ
jgi:uncharacterized protein (DUF1778 family)